MRTLMQWLRRFWCWLWDRTPTLRTRHETDMPERLEAGTLYLVGEGEHVWAVAFLCPCGCGESVQLSLLRDSQPRWRAVENSDGTVTLSPSVWRTKGCCSHFFVRHGRIDWVPDGETARE